MTISIAKTCPYCKSKHFIRTTKDTVIVYEKDGRIEEKIIKQGWYKTEFNCAVCGRELKK